MSSSSKQQTPGGAAASTAENDLEKPRNGAAHPSTDPRPIKREAMTPATVLAGAIQHVEKAKHVIVITTMQDGSQRTTWSDADMRFTLGSLDLARDQVIASSGLRDGNSK